MKTPNSDICLLMGLVKNQRYLKSEDGTDRFSRNVGKKLPLLAV